jgi:hypothetical protein
MLMKELQRWRLIQLRLVRSVFPCGRPIIHVQARHELLSPSIPTPQTKWLHMEERLHIIHKYINLYMHIYVCMCTLHEHGLAAGCPREQIQNPDLFICIYIYIYITPWRVVLSATRAHVNTCAITSNSLFVFAACSPSPQISTLAAEARLTACV